MLEQLLSSSIRKREFSPLNIPSLAKALREMKFEIMTASRLLPQIKGASISLEETIRNSNYVDVSIYHEVNALKQSARDLEHNLELAITEVQERIASLETALMRQVRTPVTLSTADDVSVAFHIVTNYFPINWPLAEAVLDRFSFLWTEELVTVDYDREDSVFGKAVWHANNFDDNMVELLREGDCWRVRKTLEVISKLIDKDWDCDIIVSVEIFDSLASVILQLSQSILVDEEMKWIHLIAKNQSKPIDNDISRLINSFLYSRKGESTIVKYVLNTIQGFIFKNVGNHENCIYLSEAQDIPEALVTIFFKEIGNSSIIRSCLAVLSTLLKSQKSNNGLIDICVKFESCGICEALMPIMKMYMHDSGMIRDVLRVINLIVSMGDDMDRLLQAGLLEALAQVFKFPNHFKDLKVVLRSLKGHERGLTGRLRRMVSGSDYEEFSFMTHQRASGIII